MPIQTPSFTPSCLNMSWELYVFTSGSGPRLWALGHYVCVSLNSVSPFKADAGCKMQKHVYTDEKIGRSSVGGGACGPKPALPPL